MNTIRIRNIEIGAGISKVCVPIVGTTKAEILKEAANLTQLSADLVEWRADFFQNVFCITDVLDILQELRTILGNLPLLMTFRTKQEGGETSIDTTYYVTLISSAISSNCIDLIDIELFSVEEGVEELISFAHSKDVKVILSSHDFEKTPAKEVLLSRLMKMQKLGADLPKIAVMPQNKKDVLTLLTATEEMYSCYADRPIITMSMSKDGLISRLCGEFFGSAITFGSAEKGSAPGQINAKELKRFLDFFHQLSV